MEEKLFRYSEGTINCSVIRGGGTKTLSLFVRTQEIVGHKKLFFNSEDARKFGFCLTVHHQLGKVIQMNQLDATMIY